MLGGSVIKVVSSCKINYFGHFSTIIEDFDWTNTVGEVKGSFFSWSFPPWWPKSTKSHDLVFENSITGATGARFFLFMWIYPNQYHSEEIESVLKNEVCSWPCHHLKSIFGHLDERWDIEATEAIFRKIDQMVRIPFLSDIIYRSWYSSTQSSSRSFRWYSVI